MRGLFALIVVSLSACTVDATDEATEPPFTVAGDDAGLTEIGLADTPSAEAERDVEPDTSPPKTDSQPKVDAPIDGAKALCDGFSTSPLDVPDKCDGPGGTTSTEIPVNGIYSTSWFGCYRKPDGTIYKDPFDNCEFACGPKGLCPSTMSGPECQANLQWFAADSDRYLCGTRIRVTNCLNGKAVVLATLDRGPNCTTIEKKYGAPVLDMSHPAMMYLFDGKEYGGGDKKRVIVEKVSATTPLGVVK